MVRLAVWVVPTQPLSALLDRPGASGSAKITVVAHAKHKVLAPHVLGQGPGLSFDKSGNNSSVTASESRSISSLDGMGVFSGCSIRS